MQPVSRSRTYHFVVLIAEVLDGAGEGKKKKKKKKSKKKKPEQTEPPTIGLSKFFPDGNYPEGELQEYKDESVSRQTSSFLALQLMYITAMHGVLHQKRCATTNG